MFDILWWNKTQDYGQKKKKSKQILEWKYGQSQRIIK